MNWRDALEVVAARGLGRYRLLCSDDNPDPDQREGYRAIVVRMAGEPAPESPPAYPSIVAMAANLASTAAAFAASGFELADDAEKARRLAICHACPDFDAGQGRCRLCGCFAEVKVRVGVAGCPAGKW
jgi:hypothetical protein